MQVKILNTTKGDLVLPDGTCVPALGAAVFDLDAMSPYTPLGEEPVTKRAAFMAHPVVCAWFEAKWLVAEDAAPAPAATESDDAGALKAVHRGFGKYAVMRADEELAAGLTKAEAAAFVAKAQGEG